MAESGSTPDTSKTISYDDPDAPWNREYSPEEVATWNDDIIREFRENGGAVGGDYAGSTLLILTTTGAKSGRPHTVVLGALYRDDTLYVSSFIEDRYPAWYHNVRANPEVTVELGPTTYRATAEALTGERYDEFAAWALRENPLLADYQSKVSKPLPLVVLTLGEPIEAGKSE
ncbi:nitroreductase/quinone reductase family protein [Nocardia cyriacigeorgica]|jgi:deazaflavin-dependent oxidoreductase (nitroreductase family)|uniref:nitroreductase/quinone reductase family protein n=1 Tax=Nocardia cyriacigeorgica TaxID=135487 RepID=UPI00189406AD|nr:nitroreductase/quinone reductase family protein [Nocardia cyriacigeorgica]MBF6437415.1 nitroreductase family deazaflavin-dependent oxidoreductase [Nocardia cyriacigeorgica]MBF6452985.1 nitroreductase family deazaflavin-dependent oxidoreductase [Nocardia cyriacigeorgica]MBF6480370.1 nitroreductase family deazaflavin-dependent oxidoreductase [Nocardia cyriacigeorgica]MBF6550154.1 nitroreductase family deazaflavin-dependent oxidoreductase [Nocardia cyriacigeorgica]